MGVKLCPTISAFPKWKGSGSAGCAGIKAFHDDLTRVAPTVDRRNLCHFIRGTRSIVGVTKHLKSIFSRLPRKTPTPATAASARGCRVACYLGRPRDHAKLLEQFTAAALFTLWLLLTTDEEFLLLVALATDKFVEWHFSVPASCKCSRIQAA